MKFNVKHLGIYSFLVISLLTISGVNAKKHHHDVHTDYVDKKHESAKPNDCYLKEISRIIFDSSADLIKQVFGIDNGFKSGFTFGPNFFNTWFVPLLWSPKEYAALNEFCFSPGLAPAGNFPKTTYEDIRDKLLFLFNNHSNRPMGPGSDGCVFNSPRCPDKRFIVASVVNGTVIIDGDKLAKVKGAISYDDAVAQKIVIKYLPSTWNTWHEYTQVGNYIYHVQESWPVSNGLQIIDMHDPFNPFIVPGRGDSVQFFENSYHSVYQGNVQGAHSIHAEQDRPIVWLAGGVEFQAYLPKNKILCPTDFTCNEPCSASPIGECRNWDLGGTIGLDVQDPENPKIITNLLRIYTHDIAVIKRNDRFFMLTGSLFNGNMYVIDVTHPKTLDPFAFVSSFCFPAYTLNGTLQTFNLPHDITVDSCGNFAYVTNELQNLPIHVIDIRNFDRMRIIDEVFIPTNGFTYHETQILTCPEKGINQLYASVYGRGVAVFDIKEDPSQPKLIGWNQASVKTDKELGDIPVTTGGNTNGFWTYFPLVKDCLSWGNSQGANKTSEQQANGVLSEDSAVVLFKLVSTDCSKCDEDRKDKCADCRCLCPNKNDAFVTNKNKFSFMTRKLFKRICKPKDCH